MVLSNYIAAVLGSSSIGGQQYYGAAATMDQLTRQGSRRDLGIN